jgi:hypothetical protein
MAGQMLRNRNRFEDRKKDFDQEFDRDIIADMSCVPAAGEKFYERLFDDFSSAHDQVIGERRFFATQVANEYRLSLSSMFLELRGKLMKCAGKVTCLFRKNIFQRPFDVVELLSQNAFEQIGFAREMGVEGFFAHPDFSGEIVHGDVFESVGHEMVASAGQDTLGDRITVLRGVGRGWVHTLQKLYQYFKFPQAPGPIHIRLQQSQEFRSARIAA